MKPSCDKCGGVMLPEYDANDRVESVKCTLCGKRHWRDFSVRNPTRDERDPVRAYPPRHNATGRAA